MDNFFKLWWLRKIISPIINSGWMGGWGILIFRNFLFPFEICLLLFLLKTVLEIFFLLLETQKKAETLLLETINICDQVAITNVLLWVCIWSPYAFVNMIAVFGNQSIVSPLVSQIPAFMGKKK